MNTVIKNSRQEQLDYAFHGNDSDKSLLILIGHGVTGDKDRPLATALAEALAAAGFNALRFSFSGNGQSEGDFQDSTISKEVEDLIAVIDAAKSAGFTRIGYSGHSMGGAVGVISATKDSRIDFLISLSGMVHTAKFAKVEFGDQIPDKGFMWDEPDCPLSSAYVDDLTRIDSVLPLASQIQIPWLLVHGSEDDVVPISESREIIAEPSEFAANRELIEIPGANHVFADDGLQPMIDAVTSWMKNL
ncbi:MAG: prolyl oligopeptidase family serine peptidase [Verrucomicrobia bacterium]|nr:prolyl oligopeptidase family serine peptidase [Verrucomicrobiota bacterium]